MEDEILAGLGEIDDQTARIPELEKELARVRDETAGFRAEAEERIGRLRGELERATAELTEAEKAIPDDVRQSYNRLIASHGADALARVENRTCQSCNASVTLHHTRDLEAGRFVTCKSCGRALYL